MITFSKMKKASEKEKDRLSNLPECILCHILLFIPTKDAAKTSILSKRWRFLFLAVPKIDLDEKPLHNHPKADRSAIDLNREFLDFVNKVLCGTTSIATFRLCCRKLPEASLVSLWVTTLALRDVQVVDIEQLSLKGTLKWPPSENMFWESLLVLKLSGGQIAYKSSESVLFPNLKVLNLKYLELQSQSQSQTYRFDEDGYPRVEELQLDHVSFQEHKDSKSLLQISLSTLKTLSIYDSEPSHMGVHTPQLQHLELEFYDGGIPEMQMSMCNLESVKFCHRDIGQWFTTLSMVAHARQLDLTELWGAQDELDEDCLWYQFPNLIQLKISPIYEDSLWNALQQAPNLKVLQYDMDEMVKEYSDLPEIVPICIANTLEEICIREFEGSEDDIETVEYFLQHGAVLEKLTILGRPNSVTLSNLLKLKRRSPNCVVEFIS